MVTSEELGTIFSEIGNDLRLGDVTAEFAPYRDLKIRWTRASGWARFSVSDYLKGAPEEVVRDLAGCLMERIVSGETADYSERTMGWLTSEEFRDLNQDTYIERSRSIGEIDAQDSEVLTEAYRKLVSKGLVPEVEGLRMFWSRNGNVSKSGQSSCLMRVVIMNRRLLDEKVPKEVLDYCLLHELANITIPFGLDNIERKKEVNEVTNGFVGAETAKKWLDQVMMGI